MLSGVLFATNRLTEAAELIDGLVEAAEPIGGLVEAACLTDNALGLASALVNGAGKWLAAGMCAARLGSAGGRGLRRRGGA